MLILGFGRIGRIGRRLVKRCVAMEMEILVHDYVVQDGVATAGAKLAVEVGVTLVEAPSSMMVSPNAAL